MLAFWYAILKLIGGPVISGLITAYQAHLTATTTDKTIAADLAAKEIAAQQNDVNVAASVVIAEEVHWYTACIRPLMAAPFIIFTWKVLVFDKVLKLGTTDHLDANMWGIFTAIVVAYFGGRSIEKVARILKS